MIRALRASPVLLSLILVSCGDGAGEPRPEVTRLTESLRKRHVRRPDPDSAPRPETARPTELVREPLRANVARVAMAKGPGVVDERLALFAPVGTLFRLSLTLPPGGKLRFGIGAPELSPDAGSIHFVVRAGEPDHTQTVFDRVVSEPGWIDVEVELPEFRSAGEADPVIELTTSTEEVPALWAAWSSPEVVRVEDEPEPGWDVLIISLDTLRADHLGSYGYDRDTSPFLDRFSGDSFRFATAVSAAPWTLPSHRALFTGLYPVSRSGLTSRPLAEILWRHGYRTEAWTGGGVMDFRMGFGRGFDNYRVHDWIRELDQLAADLEQSRGRRRFLFLHTYEPHDPYIHTEFAKTLPGGRLDSYFDKGIWSGFGKRLTAEEKRYVEALYDGDIAYTDRQLAALFDRLEKSGRLDRTIVVVTSDHGEQFWEHGSWRHGQNLYDYQLLVPLIVHLPDKLKQQLDVPLGSRVIEQQVRLIDLYPTLLEILGIALEKEVQGRSLLPLMRGESLPEVEALAEDLNVENRDSKALRFRDYKFIRSRAVVAGLPDPQSETDELYALRADPAEHSNLAASRLDLVTSFAGKLETLSEHAWEEKRPGFDKQELDSDLENKLRALGYLGN